jgi:hypothetical protein
MDLQRYLSAGMSAFLVSATASLGDIRTVVEHNDSFDATEEFRFASVQAPSRNDAASTAKFSIADGAKDDNSGGVSALNDGQVPNGEDLPAEKFFFNAGTDGGRVSVDLGATRDVKQVNTYSWHPNSRGPQVYRLYASDGAVSAFNVQPKRGIDPATCGWKLVASVDSRPRQGEPGGQYGVGIFDSGGMIGTYRYLLFCFCCTDAADPFSNTFYSEIDVIDGNAPAPEAVKPLPEKHTRDVVEADGGNYRILIDTSGAPDLTAWAHDKLAPVVEEWYPRIVAMLPGEGYAAPEKVKITFAKGMIGPFCAATGGSHIYCAGDWFRSNLDGQALGAVVHEMAHVVQQYRLGQKKNPHAAPVPGWLTEGIADYIRWYLYEPASPDGEIAEADLSQVRYDGQYRMSANFLNWVVEECDRNLIAKLNAAIRDGEYSGDLWKQYTGRDVQQLDSEWRQSLELKRANGYKKPAE